MFQWGFAAVTYDGMVECLFNELADAEEYIFSVWEGYAYEAFCERSANDFNENMKPFSYMDYMRKVHYCLVPHIESYRVL